MRRLYRDTYYYVALTRRSDLAIIAILPALGGINESGI